MPGNLSPEQVAGIARNGRQVWAGILTNSDYISRGIANQIKLVNMTVCLYGPTTYTSKWVDWELKKSIELGKPIMGVCLYGDGRVTYYPAPLEGKPRVMWNIAEIITTMRRLAR